MYERLGKEEKSLGSDGATRVSPMREMSVDLLFCTGHCAGVEEPTTSENQIIHTLLARFLDHRQVWGRRP